MIKTFKDFDKELKGQKIYEAEMIDDIHEESMDTNEDIFREEDVIVPEMVYDNKFLLKISKIILKKLDNAGLGNFGVQPTIVNIDGVPGVYFYNHNNPEINIVVCRNVNGKCVYLFKEFNIGTKNIANLVLSTTKLGFVDIIDQLISYLTPDTIEEGLICEWFEGSFNFSEKDVDKVKNLPLNIRQSFINLLNKDSSNSVAKNIFNNSTISPYNELYSSIEELYGKINQSNVKKVVDMFNRALNRDTVHEELYNILIDCKTVKPVIKSASGVPTDVEDDEELKLQEEKFKQNIEKDTEEYEKSLKQIYKTTSAFCRYVKTNCQYAIPTRGLLITGVGGVGKSKNVKKALEDKNMVKDKDFFDMSSCSTAAQSLYKKFYDFNGKLLIFDDSANLFDSEYKQSMWKRAFDPDEDNNTIGLSREVTGNNKTTYSPTGKTRYERYFLEVGVISEKEKNDFFTKKKKELVRKYTDEKGYLELSDSDINKLVADAWDQNQETREPLMPNMFKYKGTVVIISNNTREQFIKEVGAGNWGAITDRFKCVDLHPEPESVWAVIKKILLKEKEMSEDEIPSKMCMIPREMIDEFIEEVERLLKQPNYRLMTFRIVAKQMNIILNDPEMKEDWKEELAIYMNKNK